MRRSRFDRANDIHLRQTECDFRTKVSMTKIYGSADSNMETVTGWEVQPPQEGKPYRVYTGRGKILTTTPLEHVTIMDDKVLIKTVHSLYEIRYSEGGRHLP